MHTLKNLIKGPSLSHAEAQSLPQSSHEGPVCAWGFQGLSYLRALQPCCLVVGRLALTAPYWL